MYMSIEKLLEYLNINKVGTYSTNDTYVIDIEDSTEFGKVFSILDNNPDLDKIAESSLLTRHNGSFQFQFEEDYILTLISDWDNDTYKLTIKEI